jgi:uncharacterized protein YlxW (UPF0749 family)
MPDPTPAPTSGPTSGPTPELPARVRMPLLTLITQQSLDEDYLVAAERRAAGAPRPPRGRPQRTAAVVIAVFGILASTAFVQTSRNADVDTASRETLIAKIEAESDRLADRKERVATLSDRIEALERTTSRFTDAQQGAAVTLRRLQVRTGFVAVTGEGVRVTVTQVPNADVNQEVKDSDLALLANGLWQAGAEAISVNGQRLSSVSAIRTSGSAIEVNFVGVAPPYTVLAIGDTRTLQARFLDTSSGLAFGDLSRYGIEYDMDDVSELVLPSAPSDLSRLRSARAPTEEDTMTQRSGEAS